MQTESELNKAKKCVSFTSEQDDQDSLLQHGNRSIETLGVLRVGIQQRSQAVWVKPQQSQTWR